MRRLLALAERIPIFKLLIPLYVLIIAVFVLLVRRGDVQILNPAGYVAGVQSQIFWAAITLAAVVACTLIASFFIIVFRYRDGKHSRYEPTWTASTVVQLLAWILPTSVIVIISVFVWNTAHLLDPYKPLTAATKPVTIQVVALQWKWLFIYPDDGVATVNQLVIPVNTPISLKLTADAPMSSFWVPRLSGQIYAMTGMITQLHIEANQPGTYAGADAEINGDGYSGMEFTVQAVSTNAYTDWRRQVRTSHAPLLNTAAYASLAQPSSYTQPATYRLADSNLFDAVVMQFMEPGANISGLTVRGAAL